MQDQEVVYHLSQIKDTSRLNPISRLVMRRIDICMLCNAQCDTTRYSMGEYLTGWLFCNTCRTNGLLARTVHRHMIDKKIIPCDWMFSTAGRSTQLVRTRVLKFIGDTSSNHPTKDTKKEIINGSINDIGYYVLIMSKTYNQLYVKVDTEDAKKEPMQYPVSLANLFAHNPGLYEEMIMCKNFTGHDGIAVGYDDMTDEIKLEIKKSYDHAVQFQSGIGAMDF